MTTTLLLLAMLLCAAAVVLWQLRRRKRRPQPPAQVVNLQTYRDKQHAPQPVHPQVPADAHAPQDFQLRAKDELREAAELQYQPKTWRKPRDPRS